MTKEQIDEFLRELRANGRADLEEVDLTEVYCAAEFVAYRNGRRVRIRIEDHGPDCHPAPRYRCRAETGDGRVATGNGGPKAEWTISEVHWETLDEPAVE